MFKISSAERSHFVSVPGRIYNQSTTIVTQSKINLKISSANGEQYPLASIWINNDNIVIKIQENNFLQIMASGFLYNRLQEIYLFKSLDTLWRHG